jgi:hypothetical protein
VASLPFLGGTGNQLVQPEESGEQDRNHWYCYQQSICIGLNCRHDAPVFPGVEWDCSIKLVDA